MKCRSSVDNIIIEEVIDELIKLNPKDEVLSILDILYHNCNSTGNKCICEFIEDIKYNMGICPCCNEQLESELNTEPRGEYFGFECSENLPLAICSSCGWCVTDNY